MKLAAWNVNSLKVRLPHLLAWLSSEDAPDVICLQEIKLEDHNFPVAALEEAGYRSVFAGQKAFNGVAIIFRHELGEPCDVQKGNPCFPDPQQRLLAATIDGIRVISAYFPNGEAVESEKYLYKLSWMKALHEHLTDELRRYPALALCGDFNIAPEDADIHDPLRWSGGILCSDSERQAFRGLISLGLADSFRLFPQPEKSFSWWDYRQWSFHKNLGLRIDHILLSEQLASSATASGIKRELRGYERPSDHAPVWTEIEPGGL
ncbi:MAG: exodeoxyribonuclease III [Betaproteobacteria bacterium]|nr:exodeoxyribonuclease III [Betaproteobacteria bacterium]